MQAELSQFTTQWLEYAVRWSMRQQQREMQIHGLSHAKLHTLFYLHYHPQSRLVDLARYTGVSRAASSQLVDGMESQGLISRAADASDRRNKTLALTEKGQALVLSFQTNRFKWLQLLIESFTPEEADAFKEVTELLNRKVRELFPDPDFEIEKTDN